MAAVRPKTEELQMNQATRPASADYARKSDSGHRFRSESDLRAIVEVVYRLYLGREPEPEGFGAYAEALKGGMSLAAFADEVANSEEARQRKAAVATFDSHSGARPDLPDNELRTVIKLVFNQFLQRDPTEGDFIGYVGALKNGLSLTGFADQVANSEEARQRNASLAALDALSDGEFILMVAELLFEGCGANPVQLEAYKQFLQETPQRRSDLVNRLVADHIGRLRAQRGNPHDPYNCWIMGTPKFLTPMVWKERASQIAHKSRAKSPSRVIPLEDREFRHSGEYAVSAIASLYKGRRYLETFLENITSQTLFDRSELIIIDANSPEKEAELIQRYQKVYPNIVYKRMNYRIGIYEAWNEGVQLARGRCLTNTNLDDLRRKDSFELQATALAEHAYADVVYQDFFYSFDDELDFEQVAEFGFKSKVPIVTANNLLCYNSPHNAPMWRARLHEEVGMFDTSFKSAGDYEFWLRCVLNGKKFYKLNTPHVVYFQNPEGISTSFETRGIEEGRRLIKMYARKLISPYLSMSRRDFAAALNASPDWAWETPAFAVVQRELRRLGGRF